jgi:hypothetical protein
MSEIDIRGTYVYRSLINNQDVKTDFKDLEFGRGTMNVTQKDSSIDGTFDMGGGYKMTLEGTVFLCDKNSYLRMTGKGVPGTLTDKWVYDYFGIIIPVWPKALAQKPTIIGSVIRSVDH